MDALVPNTHTGGDVCSSSHAMCDSAVMQQASMLLPGGHQQQHQQHQGGLPGTLCRSISTGSAAAAHVLNDPSSMLVMLAPRASSFTNGLQQHGRPHLHQHQSHGLQPLVVSDCLYAGSNGALSNLDSPSSTTPSAAVANKLQLLQQLQAAVQAVVNVQQMELQQLLLQQEAAKTAGCDAAGAAAAAAAMQFLQPAAHPVSGMVQHADVARAAGYKDQDVAPVTPLSDCITPRLAGGSFVNSTVTLVSSNVTPAGNSLDPVCAAPGLARQPLGSSAFGTPPTPTPIMQQCPTVPGRSGLLAMLLAGGGIGSMNAGGGAALPIPDTAASSASATAALVRALAAAQGAPGAASAATQNEQLQQQLLMAGAPPAGPQTDGGTHHEWDQLAQQVQQMIAQLRTLDVGEAASPAASVSLSPPRQSFGGEHCGGSNSSTTSSIWSTDRLPGAVQPLLSASSSLHSNSSSDGGSSSCTSLSNGLLPGPYSSTGSSGTGAVLAPWDAQTTFGSSGSAATTAAATAAMLGGARASVTGAGEAAGGAAPLAGVVPGLGGGTIAGFMPCGSWDGLLQAPGLHAALQPGSRTGPQPAFAAPGASGINNHSYSHSGTTSLRRSSAGGSGSSGAKHLTGGVLPAQQVGGAGGVSSKAAAAAAAVASRPRNAPAEVLLQCCAPRWARGGGWDPKAGVAAPTAAAKKGTGGFLRVQSDGGSGASSPPASTLLHCGVGGVAGTPGRGTGAFMPPAVRAALAAAAGKAGAAEARG